MNLSRDADHPAVYTFRQEDDYKRINLHIAKEWIENE